MSDPFLKRLHLESILSFRDRTEIEFQPLNVVIGPNGSGKSNLIEIIDLYRALPGDFGSVIRRRGGAEEFLWKGDRRHPLPAYIRGTFSRHITNAAPVVVKHEFEFDSLNNKPIILNENIVEIYGGIEIKTFEFRDAIPWILMHNGKIGDEPSFVTLDQESFESQNSVLNQKKDRSFFPEIAWLGRSLEQLHIFRDWTFGPYSEVRLGSRTDDVADYLIPGSQNLGLILNELMNEDSTKFDTAMKRFLPRYERLTTSLRTGNVQIFLNEMELARPISARRLSDGTLRFMAMLALLLAPNPPPLLCIEEPELGMHPDAVSLLAELFVEASSRMQLIITTHSDALLSALNDHVGSVLVCENNGGGTEVRRLDADRLKHWLGKYSLGEIWRLGEIGGNP